MSVARVRAAGEAEDPGGERHVPALDGVRGLAVAMPVCYHLLLIARHPGSRGLMVVYGVLNSMWLGVDLFLALSGFLITGILYDMVRGAQGLRTFWGRRVLRTFPLYFAALAVLWVMSAAMGWGWGGKGWVLAGFLENTPLYFGGGGFGRSGAAIPFPLDGYAGHLWSVSLEEQFYLFWPAVVMLVRDRRRLMTVAAVLAGVALGLRVWMVWHGFGGQWTYKLLPCRMDGLLLGGWLALALRGPARARVLASCGWVAGGAATVLLWAGVREGGLDWRTSAWVNSVGYTVAALGFTALIGLALRPGVVERVLGGAGWRWLGRYSYGIYVWHAILGGFGIIFGRHAALALGLGKDVGIVLGGVLGVGLGLGMGWASYWGYEVWFLRLKRYLPYRKA